MHEMATSQDAEFDAQHRQASYVIGIDLGTTNCSLAYARLGDKATEVRLLDIPQWDGEGRLFSEPRLPSFAWLIPKSLQKSGARRLPWDRDETPRRLVVGREAKAEALREQSRVIHSAKSWLSVGASSTRQSAFLPWGSAGVSADEKLSPIAVESAYLEHLRQAWDAVFNVGPQPKPFALQKIVITVPASFDELAQRLTLKAAAMADYPADISLLEEPLAAFYDLDPRQLPSAQEREQLILICDIGGGTSDFSLLRCQGQGETQNIERIKVSEHILLGGDNIDLELANRLLTKMKVEELPRASWSLLLAQTRQLKEDVLSREGLPDEEYFVSAPLQPGQLLGAYASASITRAELISSICEGFLPEVTRDAQPLPSKTRGLSHWALPYAEDSAITRHLAAFLAGQNIDAVLFAGGTLIPNALQQHMLKVLQSWQGSKPILQLKLDQADLAIARGAAVFAKRREELQQIVESPYPKSLFVALQSSETEPALLCLIPRGWPRGKAASLHVPGLSLRLGSEVAFQLYASAGSPDDRIGQLVQDSLALQSLPIISVRLDKGQDSKREIPISLEAMVRETGILELRCLAEDGSQQSWRLDFTVEGEANRSLRQTPAGELNLASPKSATAAQLISSYFAKDAPHRLAAGLTKQIEELLGPRTDWNIATLRSLWPSLEDAMFRRQRDPEREASWLYWSGFSLRPGFGASRDRERIQSIWRIFDHGFKKGEEQKKLDAQWCLLWRRIAGGLSREQQNRLLEKMLPRVRKEEELGPELLRLVASLERADMNLRLQLGRALLTQICSGKKDQLDAKIWALARLANRMPLYAGPETILPIATIEEWAASLADLPIRSKAYQKLSLFYLWAGRRRGEQTVDLDPSWREHFKQQLQILGASAEQLQALQVPSGHDVRHMEELFGEQLPWGLFIK